MRALTPLMFQVAMRMRLRVARPLSSCPGLTLASIPLRSRFGHCAGMDCRIKSGNDEHETVVRDATQIEKLVPQPQEATACGFLIWKDWPIRSSTKSISEPPIYSQRDRVDQHRRAVAREHDVVGCRARRGRDRSDTGSRSSRRLRR